MKNDQQKSDSEPVRDCRSAMAELFKMLDGECTAEKERQLRLHITSCPDCFTQADFEKRFLDAISASKDGGGCPDGVRKRILSALREAGLTGNPTA